MSTDLSPAPEQTLDRGTATTGRDIILVCNSEQELGGLTTWIHHIAQLFADRGHSVRVVGVTPPTVRDTRPRELGYPTETLCPEGLPGRTRARGGPLRRLDLAARRAGARREAVRTQAVERLNTLFRAARPGAVVIVAQVWAMELVVDADTTGLKVIGMSHESFEATKATSRFLRVQRYYADVDRLLALTQQDADAWARQGMSSVSAMPNPLPLTAEHTAPRTAKVVMSLGRLSHEKGYDMLLDAWAQVAPRAADWTLRIYGDGEEREALKAQCAALGLQDSVDFAGRTGDVASALRGSSVLVQPSRAEGFPLTLLEAMAHGIPCVSFDCAPGVREIIEDEVDGLVVQPGDVDAFARAVSRLIDDRELRERLGDRAFQEVQRFAPETIAVRWEQLFDFLYR